MNPTIIGTLAFACTFGGVLLGMWLHTILPEHHLDAKSRDAVNVGIALIATMTAEAEGLAAALRRLEPRDDSQRALQSRAQELTESLLETRWLVFAGVQSSIPVLFLAILLFWLTITFVSFGLFAPRNGTVVAVLFVCAVSVACAVFLVLELDSPFDGVLRIPPDAMHYAYVHLNQ